MTSNAMNEFLKPYLENLSNKKNLKTTTQFFENIVKTNGFEIEYNIISAIFESIDWKDVFKVQEQNQKNNLGQNPKDSFKIDYLKKKLKQMKFESNFVDYFGPCIAECSNKSSIYDNFRDILKVLKIGAPLNLIFSTSFAMNILEKRQDLLGTAMLKEQLKEIAIQDKPQLLPTDFVLTLCEFLKSEDSVFKDVRDSVKIFFENYLVPLKDTKLKSLFAVGEPEIAFSEAGKDAPAVDISKITKVSPKLFALMKELIWNKSNISETVKVILKEIQSISESEICETILLMIAENTSENQTTNKGSQMQKQYIEFALESILFNPEEAISTQAAFKNAKDDPKANPNEWNIDQFIQVMNETFKKSNWDSVVKALGHFNFFPTSETFTNPKFYEKVYQIIEQIKKTNNIKLINELIQSKWINPEFQFNFMFNLITFKDSKTGLFSDVLEKSKEIQTDQINSLFVGFLQHLDSFFLNYEFMNNLFELAGVTNSNNTLKSYFESSLNKNFEGTFYVFVLLSQKTNHKLIKELLKTATVSILNAPNNFPELVELFFKTNKNLFVQILSDVCTGENACVYLSKVIDFSQNIKDFVLPLTQTEHHYFSISLSLLAIKREYLRLENWIEERLSVCGLAWVNEFLFYIQRNFLDFVKPNATKKTIDELMEKGHLSKNVLAIVFENFLLSEKNFNIISKQSADKIKQFYGLIQAILPDLAQVNSVDTEKKSNEILESLYNEKIKVDDFIHQIQVLKNSSGNCEQEILSCIILNIIDEYRFYHNFPDKELYLTSEMYGKFISNRLIDGKAHTIFLKAISDSLEKDGKMFNFGLKALGHFVMNMDLNIPNDFYKLLFANEKLRKTQYLMLFDLRKRLAENDRERFIDPDNLKIVNQNVEIFNKDREEEEAAKINKERIEREAKMEESQKGEKNLNELLSRNFETAEKDTNISDKSKEKITYWINSLDERRMEKHLIEFEDLMKEAESVKWFSIYLVYKRVPTEPIIQNSYRKLIYRSSVKNLYKLVYKNSMQMINLVIDFVSSKELLLPEEKNTSKFCGKWIGLITLVCNKPILLSDLDIKKKLYICTENKTVSNVIPIICTFLKNIEKSNLFNIKVPYINSIIDILREILHLSWLNHTTKIFIEVVFSEFEIQDKNIHKFNFISQRRDADNGKSSSMNIRPLLQYVKVDNSLVQEHRLSERLHVDIKTIVAIAINSSIQDIIRPVLERSVKIALDTTRELILKDFAFETDEKKFFEYAKNMIQNLSWNLALVTCRDPLRSQLSDHLSHLLKIMSDLDENARKNIRENLASTHLDVACQIVKRHVMDNSIEDLTKDEAINAEIEARRFARLNSKSFVSEYANKYLKDFPPGINCPESLIEVDKIEIYTTKYGPSNVFEAGNTQNIVQSNISEGNFEVQKTTDEGRITDLIKQIEKEFESPNEEEKIKQMHSLFNNFRKSLEGLKGTEGLIQKLADSILTKIFLQSVTLEVLRYYSDILIVFRNNHPKFPSFLTTQVFKIDETNRYKQEVMNIFLKNYLLEPSEFDEKYSELLTVGNITGTICIVEVLKNVIIEEKIFSPYSFPKIVDKLVKLSQTELINSINLESSIFIHNLVQYVTNENTINTLKLNLSIIEPEYNKLFLDMKSHFAKLDERIYSLALELIDLFNEYPTKQSFLVYFNKHQEFIQQEKNFVIYFGYMFEMSINYTESLKKRNNLQEHMPIDYRLVDCLCEYIIFYVEQVTRSSYTFEKILTSFIMILSKKYFCENPTKINQRPFFRIFQNLIQEVHCPEFKHAEQVAEFDLSIVQAIQILQPLKYPSLSFAWLQLISNPSLMNSILKSQNKSLTSQYNKLLKYLMMFIRDVFTLNKKNKVEMELFYKGILKLLLILLLNFPDYLCENNFIILEEIDPKFIQFRNMVLSAFPKNLKSPEPFEISNQNYQNSSEYKVLPTINNKIEHRVASYGIQNHIFTFIKTKDQKEIDKIISLLYIYGYKNDKQINVPLIESLVVYVPYLIYSRFLNRLSNMCKPIDVLEL